ncbi:MAG: CHAT domain-containing protein [Synergistaceae bacterium]|nr:CHAT domain-containing protein [Synergistaceae bacterium]
MTTTSISVKRISVIRLFMMRLLRQACFLIAAALLLESLLWCDAARAAASGDELFNNALAAYREQKMESAAKAFGAAGQAYEKIKHNSKAAQSYYNQGLCLAALGMGEPAAGVFERAAEQYRKAKNTELECNARLNAARFYMAAMQWDKAGEHLDRCVKIASKFPPLLGRAQEALGELRRENGRLDEAGKFFEAAEKTFVSLKSAGLAGRLRVRLRSALIDGLQGKVSQALKTYDSVIKEAAALQKDKTTRTEGDRIVFYARGDKGSLLMKTGWFEEARKTFSEALDFGKNLWENNSPEMMNTRNNHAAALMYLGDFSEAEKEFNSLLPAAAAGGNTILEMEINAALGVLNRMKGRYEEAFEFFGIFRSLASKNTQAQRLAQAYIQLANLYSHTGMWEEAAAHYQEAFSASLKVQDMDAVLTAMRGIYAGDLRNELGLVGKVDYRYMQRLPWKAALTARSLREGSGGRQDEGFVFAWKNIDALRGEIYAPIPSLDGFRLVRETALRVPELRQYYQEAKAAWYIGDAVLRQASERLRLTRNAGEALRGLAAREKEAADKQYVRIAGETTLKLLQALAGKELLSVPKGGAFFQIGGIFIEATDPDDDRAEADEGSLNADIQTLSRAITVLSPKASESTELQKALADARPLPEAMRTRLRKTLFGRALKTPPPSGEMLKILFRLLETTHPSLKKEAGRLAMKGGKLYKHAESKLSRQMKELEREAAELLPRTSPYLLLSLNAGEDMLHYLKAWENMRRRAAIVKELGIALKPDKNWTVFFNQFGGAIQKAMKSAEFGTKPDGAAVGKLIALSEKMALMDLADENANIDSLLAAEGKISYDDRLSFLELQARIRHALSEPEKAEKTARALLALVADPGGPAEGKNAAELPPEIQPEMQWRAYGLLARIAEDRHEAEEAARLYETAISRLAEIHPVEGTTSQGTADRAAVYSGAVRTAFEVWSKNPSPENVSALWRVLEGMKSRQWRELLATTGGEFLNALPPEAREAVRELEIRRVALEGAYRQASYAGRREEMLRINNQIRALREERSKLTRDATVDVEDVPDAAEVRAALPADWGLADYYLSPSLSFAVLLQKTAEPQVIPLDGLDYDALFGYSYWMRFREGEAMEYDSKKFPGKEGRPRATACGLSPEDAGNVLFRPVAARFKDIRKLLVIPHDILYVLPIEAMQQREKDKVSFLISDWTLAELPSAFLLTRNEKRLTKDEKRPSPEDKDNSLMLVANPAYATLFSGKNLLTDNPDDKEKILESLKTAVSLDAEISKAIERHITEESLTNALSAKGTQEERKALSDALNTVWQESLNATNSAAKLAFAVKKDFAHAMRPLNGSQREVDDLTTLWGESGGMPTVLLMGHASESKFWENDPGRYRFIHFACHGYDRGTIPDLQPGLALSPILDTTNDSFLQMGELSTVKWNAELVTLSACETGLGDLYVGDGMFGLSTVLLAGGAKGAILSRWTVPDESAPVFMRKLYSEILKGVPPVDALRAAQIYLREGDFGFRAPQHWAVFKYVGIPW